MLTVDAIGETAGHLWQLLNQRGAMSLSAVRREVPGSDALADMALGWLAREGKLELRQEKRGIQVRLK